MDQRSTQGKGSDIQQEEHPAATLKRFLKTLMQEMEGTKFLVGEGLNDLVREIIQMIDTQKAGGGALIGYLRELLYGYHYFLEKTAVQFGLIGPDLTVEAKSGAGGDITLFTAPDYDSIPLIKPPENASLEELYEILETNMQTILSAYRPLRTIQSKYVVSDYSKEVATHINKAAQQLSGLTDEMPYLKSERVISIVIESPKAAQSFFFPLTSVHEQIILALGDENFDLDPWDHVDLIDIVADLGPSPLEGMHKDATAFFQQYTWKEEQGSLVVTCIVTLDPQNKTLTVGPLTPSKKLYKDFPGVFLFEHIPLRTLLLKYSQSLPSGSAEKQTTTTKTPTTTSTKTVDMVSVQLTAKEAACIGEIKDGKSNAKTLLLTYCEIVLPPICAALGLTKEQCDFLIQLLQKGSESKALGVVQSVVGQIGRSITAIGDQSVPLKQDQKGFFNLLTTGQKPQKTTSSLPSPTERLTRLYKEYPDQEDLLRKTYAVLIPPQSTLMLNIQHQVITNLELIAAHPYGQPACEFIISTVMKRARNATEILSQLKAGNDCTTVLGPVNYAALLFKRQKERPDHRYQDCILAFEYDENTPGMWQVTRDHFDMDIGWIQKNSPLTILALYQVKLIDDLSSAVSNAEFAITQQLQFPGHVDKGLVIYCPNNIPSDLFWWTYDAAKAFTACMHPAKTQGITIEIFFDNVNNPAVAFNATEFWLLGRAISCFEKALPELEFLLEDEDSLLIWEVSLHLQVYSLERPIKALAQEILALLQQNKLPEKGSQKLVEAIAWLQKIGD